MLKEIAYIALGVVVLFGLGFCTIHFAGDGALKRHVTLSGLYEVCRPGGYDAVCFMDADSKQGGASCLPLSQVGGKCF